MAKDFKITKTSIAAVQMNIDEVKKALESLHAFNMNNANSDAAAVQLEADFAAILAKM